MHFPPEDKYLILNQPISLQYRMKMSTINSFEWITTRQWHDKYVVIPIMTGINLFFDLIRDICQPLIQIT